MGSSSRMILLPLKRKVSIFVRVVVRELFLKLFLKNKLKSWALFAVVNACSVGLLILDKSRWKGLSKRDGILIKVFRGFTRKLKKCFLLNPR